MNLPDLSLLRLDFRLRAESSVALPPFLGSTLRGAFGTALKKALCFVPHGELELLAFLHAEPAQKIDYREALPGTENIRVVDKSLQLYLYEQKSNRQERIIPREVFLDRVLYQGDRLKEFLPFLKAGEILNVGADTVHGMGRFTIKL